MRRLVRHALALVHWWWHSDRIRVTPREGRLLSLRPPCFVRVAGEPAVVTARRIESDGGGPRLVHGCSAAAGDFDLLVRPTPFGADVTVRRDGAEWAVAADEVEVIPAGPGVACSCSSSS